jgi:predicted Zn-dependent peptidase
LKEYGLSSHFATKDKDKVLTIIKVLLNPVLTLPNLKKKKRLLVRLEQQKESPQSVIGAYFESILYGDHVYGNIVTGNQSTVSKLMNDLGSFTK